MELSATDRGRLYLDGVEERIDTIVDLSITRKPRVSVIVVTYSRNELLISCLNSLRDQTYRDFEIILVDNGGNDRVQKEIRQHPVTYARLEQNLGPSMGRNVGIRLAKGPVVVFLDDDLIAAPDLVEAHARAHRDLDIVALRGRCLPRTRTIYNALQFHYDLGDQVKPRLIDLIGNSSFKREVLLRVGGFNPRLFGHEEVELTYRLVTVCGVDRQKIVYCPDPVGYHDYSRSISDYAAKRLRHTQTSKALARMHPGIEQFVRSYVRGSSLRPWRSLPRRTYRVALRTALNLIVDLGRGSWGSGPVCHYETSDD